MRYIESLLEEDKAIIMVDESLSKITNNYYVSATHRVIGTPEPRYSFVAQYRLKADTLIHSSDYETKITGPFSTLFTLSGEDIYRAEKARRQTSVNDIWLKN